MAEILAQFVQTASLGGTDVERLLEMAISIGEQTKIHEGDGLDPDVDVIGHTINIDLTFNNNEAAEKFLGLAEGNLVVDAKIKGSLDSNPGQWTIKNVRGLSGQSNIPRKSGGQQTGTVTVRARARFGAGDTIATMIVYAPPT